MANARYGWYLPGKKFDSGSNLLHAYFIQQEVQGVGALGKANQISKTKLDLDYSLYRWIAFETNLFGDPVSTLPVASLPNAPTLTVSVADTATTLFWNTVANAGGYVVYYAPAPYTGPDSITGIDVGENTWKSINFGNGASYLVAVKAYNDLGSSGYSNIERVVIP